MKLTRYLTFIVAAFACLGFSLSVAAAVPGTITYHGALSDSAGQPINTQVEAKFSIYDADKDGTEAWTEDASTIDVNNGSFTVQLGAENPLGEVLDGKAFWLEVTIHGEVLSPRTAIESVPYALRANSAVNAITVGGKTPAEIITAAGEGGGNAELLATLLARIEALEAASSDHAAGIAANSHTIGINSIKIAEHTTAIGTINSKITENSEGIAANTTSIGINTGDIQALEALTQDMKRETINGKQAVSFNAVNVHIRNGKGATGGAVDGLGNLIVGYDEARTTGSAKTGSHNLVVGAKHNYTSYGGFVTGIENSITGQYTSVSGGQLNIASGNYSTVSGGAENKAIGLYSSVGSGRQNDATNEYSSVFGGRFNEAIGERSTVSGGQYNKAIGHTSSVTGGMSNTASGEVSSVTGGTGNIANGQYSVISAGQNTSVTGQFEWRAGAGTGSYNHKPF